MRKLENILITGNTGGLGINLFKSFLKGNPNFTGKIIDAGNNHDSAFDFNEKYVRLDVFPLDDISRLYTIMTKYRIDTIVYIASIGLASGKTDTIKRSLEENVSGIYNMLEAVRRYWIEENEEKRQTVFYYLNGLDYETYTKIAEYREPHSLETAVIISGEQMALSFYHHYGVPVIVSNCFGNPTFIWDILNNGISGRKYEINKKGKIKEWL